MKIIKEAKAKPYTKRLHEEDEETVVNAAAPGDEVIDKAELLQDIEDGTAEDASAADIADAVTAEVELATGGAETYSETKAQQIAREVKAQCADFDRATWAPLRIPHKFTKLLDECLSNARYFKYQGSSAGTDILVTGLPGSGKTAVFKSWCRERGVKFKYINAKDEDLSAAINGFSVHEVDEVDNRKVHSVVQAGSKKLLSLIDTPTVLFLDEFNRAPAQLRAQLLTLINEHQVAGDDPDDDSGFVTLHGLLFTVACINPTVGTDTGALVLNQAERSRMVRKLTMNSDPGDALRYLNSMFNDRLKALDPNDPTYAYSYRRTANTLNLALTLLTDPRFSFDGDDEETLNELDLDDDPKTIWNQRLLTDALEGCGYDKEAFLDWVDNESNLRAANIDMIHDILDNWNPPAVQLPGEETDPAAAAPAPQPAANTQAANDVDEDDELDVDLFGGPASAASKAARVDATTVRRNLSSFDFSL